MTKAQIKDLRNLRMQKYRKRTKTYLVEGEKNVREWLLDDRATIRQIVALPEWIRHHQELLEQHDDTEIITARPDELEKISALKHAQQVLLTVAWPQINTWIPTSGCWYLFLDRIQDPGNMGTIIRTADWFGIGELLLSPDCVEVFNPKVVQASMGSLLHVKITSLAVDELVAACRQNMLPVYATSPAGENLFASVSMPPGIIALGNEAAGLSSQLLQAATVRLSIPGKGKAESLNVGVATGILCAQLIR